LISSPKTHPEQYVKEVRVLLDKAQTSPWAWLKERGVEAIRDEKWLYKVLSKQNYIEDFVFVNPRNRYTARPSVLTEMSKHRMGTKNPALLGKPIYNIKEMKRFSKLLFYLIRNRKNRFSYLVSSLNKSYPQFKWSFVGKFEKNDVKKRGHNNINRILSFLLDISVDDIVRHKILDRGHFISMGQRKSKKMTDSIKEKAGVLKHYISKSHKELYSLIVEKDPDAIIEKHLEYENAWKSFDIYSPKLNTLIEMHGRVWHDPENTKKSLYQVALNNFKNDIIKEKLAKFRGFNYAVFWDDHKSTWKKDIEQLYENK
jgi:hypothetical protein